MKITMELANTLMDCLCCLAVCAMTTHKNANETPLTISKATFETAENWARNTFVKTCAEWENFYDEDIKVVDENEDE